MKLWEIKHPYYCNEDGYYYSASRVEGWGAAVSYATFADFIEDGSGDADLDMNLVFRWDWERRSDVQHEKDCDEPATSDMLNSDGNVSTLKLFVMMQRKGCKRVITITHMEDADEPAVIAYLNPRWERLKMLWEPIA